MTIEAIFSEPKRLTVMLNDGTKDDLIVAEYTLGQLPNVIKLSQSVYGAIAESMQEHKPEQLGELVSQLIADGGDDFYRLLGISIKRNREWFDRLPIDQGIDVISAVLETNMSFFVQRVLPKFKTSMDRLRAIGSSGQTPSQS